jgi:regulator of nonsense transcripts 2
MELVEMLEKEFNELYASNDLIKIETKIRNIRFLAELTKFQVSSPNLIFACFKR